MITVPRPVLRPLTRRRSVPKLQRLNLYALPGLTDAGLAALRCLTTLVTLDIEYCKYALPSLAVLRPIGP